MRQLFAPGADAVFRLVIFSVVVGVAALLFAAGAVSRSSAMTDVGIAPEQPVPFSHKHHAGELGIDCRYCHTTVEKLATSGIPPTWTCMTCHSQIWTNSPMLAPVRESLARDIPLQWERVNRLPDYVYYNHSIHIAKSVGCSSCHGAVDRMQLTYKAQAFTMAFCLDCHRNPAAYLRPAAEVWNMEWVPPPDQASRGAALVAAEHIRSPDWLSQCSICHR